MKTFLDWMFRVLTGAVSVVIFLAIAGSYVFPLSLPLLTTGGRKLVLNMPDVIGLIVIVLFAAAAFYIIGFVIWRAISVLWSKF